MDSVRLPSRLGALRLAIGGLVGSVAGGGVASILVAPVSPAGVEKRLGRFAILGCPAWLPACGHVHNTT